MALEGKWWKKETLFDLFQNGLGCRVLFMLTKYSRMTNYMWMFCEGFYLHKLIASAFAEQKSLCLFYIIGWGKAKHMENQGSKKFSVTLSLTVFPIIPIFVYGSLRALYADERCWAVPIETFEWVVNGPSLLSLLVRKVNFLQQRKL